VNSGARGWSRPDPVRAAWLRVGAPLLPPPLGERPSRSRANSAAASSGFRSDGAHPAAARASADRDSRHAGVVHPDQPWDSATLRGRHGRRSGQRPQTRRSSTPNSSPADHHPRPAPPYWATADARPLPVPAASTGPVWMSRPRRQHGRSCRERHEKIRPTTGAVSSGPASLVLVPHRGPATGPLPPVGTTRSHLPHLAAASPGPVGGSTRPGRGCPGAPAAGALVDPSHGCRWRITGRAVVLLRLPLRGDRGTGSKGRLPHGTLHEVRNERHTERALRRAAANFDRAWHQERHHLWPGH
jgi:hypothetical protein